MGKSRTSNYMDEQFNKRFRFVQNQRKQIDSEASKNPLKYPTYSSGARTFIQVAGKPLTVAMEFNYSITVESEEIRTIDTSFPWDISLGQVKITGTLRKIVHPETSAEEQGLFHTMQSIVHQPYVEILVQDADGSSQFFARGMFTSIQSGFSRGQITVQSVGFVGVAYQHWAFQEFRPYPPENALSKFKNFTSKLTSGARKFGL